MDRLGDFCYFSSCLHSCAFSSTVPHFFFVFLFHVFCSPVCGTFYADIHILCCVVLVCLLMLPIPSYISINPNDINGVCNLANTKWLACAHIFEIVLKNHVKLLWFSMVHKEALKNVYTVYIAWYIRCHYIQIVFVALSKPLALSLSPHLWLYEYIFEWK